MDSRGFEEIEVPCVDRLKRNLIKIEERAVSVVPVVFMKTQPLWLVGSDECHRPIVPARGLVLDDHLPIDPRDCPVFVDI